MKNERKEFLLGVINNRILIGEIEITTRNGYEEFTASFEEGEAFNIDSIDKKYITDYYEDLWDCYDDTQKINLLLNGSKTKDELFEEWIEEADYKDIIDCSCTDYEFSLNNTTYNFVTTCCGQHDIREDDDFIDMIFTNKEAFKKLMKLWDNYHLRFIPEEKQKEVKKLMTELAPFEVDSVGFYDFIKNNIKID